MQRRRRSIHYSDSQRAGLKAFMAKANRSEKEFRQYLLENLSVPNSPADLMHVLQDLSLDNAVDSYEADEATIPKVPGYGLPVDYMPSEQKHFPRLMLNHFGQPSWNAHTLLIKELCIFRVVEELTNKPEWWLKVRKDEIADKWKKEMLETDWKTKFTLWAHFTKGMADADVSKAIEELRAKADLYERSKLIPVMDYSATALKSDSIMSEDLVQRLKDAVAPLENVPEAEKDWHPNSDDKVLDIVHPSLWPLVYGKTRVLPDKTIGVDDCLQHCGMGVTLPALLPQRSAMQGNWTEEVMAEIGDGPSIDCSGRFQWLPCDVSLDAGRAKIASYINNVHPVNDAALYPVIESFINMSLPAWDLVLRWPKEYNFKRIDWATIYDMDCKTPDICKDECSPVKCPVSEGGIQDPDEVDMEDQDDDYNPEAYYDVNRNDARDQWFARNHTIKLDDPRPSRYCDMYAEPDLVRGLDGASAHEEPLFGGASKIQVIVKLASIHLTPDKPAYDGGSWHIEGQLNERIVATALFYYDADNVTGSSLALRTSANVEKLSEMAFYQQHDILGIERALGIDATGPALQELGAVATRPGRALFFPNLYHHRVSPFRLADPTRPGHRKILALFLVDPAVPVLSTANVPPQRKDWWERELQGESPEELLRAKKLPNELRAMINEILDFPIDLAEAKTTRAELMKERKVALEDTEEAWRNFYSMFDFCEH